MSLGTLRSSDWLLLAHVEVTSNLEVLFLQADSRESPMRTGLWAVEVQEPPGVRGPGLQESTWRPLAPSIQGQGVFTWGSGPSDKAVENTSKVMNEMR
ncbi:unnamed protein product [Arctogadus glacialis]